MSINKNSTSLLLASPFAFLAACSGEPFDIDLRNLGNGFDTSSAAQSVTANRPQADARGIISYPNFQVAVARQGDTVDSVASRIGLGANELASFNGLSPSTGLRAGEVLALPSRVAGGADGAISSTPLNNDTSGFAALAGNAIDRASPNRSGGVSATDVPNGVEPIRHQVARGETAFTIARLYDVPVRALADWNGLAADLAVREGQFLLIPIVVEPAPEPELPAPPSADAPLPQVETAPEPTVTPQANVQTPSVNLEASNSGGMTMPVNGSIIREYSKGKNDGIDIAAPAGASVTAADGGTVAAITRDTDQVPIIVLRHSDNILTVYAGVDNVSVAKGDTVSKGQKIAVVRDATPSFLHFEVRRGLESADPMDFLN